MNNPGDTPPPTWLRDFVARLSTVSAEELSRFLPPDDAGRPSAVLILFAEGPHGPDVLLIERSAHLRKHAGQPAFPGGAVDPDDEGPVGAALREAAEETGLDPSGVEVLATLPGLWLPVTGYVVTPVIAWWRRPSQVAPVDAREVAAVVRVPISELADPANRSVLQHPSGALGPAFEVSGLHVWGFTAGLIDRLLALGGWERPWDRERVSELAPEMWALAQRGRLGSDR